MICHSGCTDSKYSCCCCFFLCVCVCSFLLLFVWFFSYINTYIKLTARQLGNMTFITYSWKCWAFLVPEIKGGGHFALQNRAQKTVEIWLSDFEPMQLKSMSKPLTQLSASERPRDHQRVNHREYKLDASVGSCYSGKCLLAEMGYMFGWGFDFDLGGRSGLQVLCKSSAEFQVPVHFLHFLWYGCRPCETSCWAEVCLRGPIAAFFTSVLTEATRSFYHANSCTRHWLHSYYPVFTTEQCDPWKLCKAEPPRCAQCVALKT